jgi:hypothetical protein
MESGVGLVDEKAGEAQKDVARREFSYDVSLAWQHTLR